MAHFAQDWAKITDDKWVLSVIRDGYRIPFQERPILSPNPVFFQQPLSQHLEEEVASLLSKGAVEEIILECPGHYSRIFLVPKKNGKLRLIIDLSVLNHFVYTQTFKMETQRKVKDAIQLNDWAFSLDLTDAYLHIPIHYRSRKFLRFTLRGRVYQFKALPFGLLTSPFVFARLMEVIASFLRSRAITLHPYLEDWLARNQKASKTVGTQTIHFVADQLTRSDHQLRKIRPSSSPSVHFHRDGVSDSYQYRQSTSEQANEDIGDSQNVFTENLCISQRFPVSLGTTECCSRSCNAGTVTSPAITNISAQSVETSESSVFSSDSYDIGNSVSSQMVASGRSLSSGDSLEDRSSLPHHHYRCQSLRLGSPCGTGGTSVSWTMDRRPIPAPHQCVRDESNFSLSITSSSQGKEHHCTGIYGQHYRGGLYKASGRDLFHRTLRRSVECPEFVLQSQHTAVSEAHTGQVQHSSRPDVPSGQTDLHRVVLESGNSKQSFPDHGLSVNRPVRHTSEPQATILCVTHTGSEGAINRCPIDGLESHTRLHVSTVPSHSSCDKQNKVIPVQDSIDSTNMARQTMVSRAPKSVGVTTGISDSNPKPTCSAKRQDSASKPGPSTASCLGIVKQSLRDRQFSRDVAEHVSKARMELTVKVYDAKWQIFRRWADQRKIDPIQATPQIVADFLTFLFSVKKCQVSTIKGYRSTSSNTLKYKTGYDFGSHPVLSELIKSFAIQRPVDRPLAPKWDLAFVLTHMCKAPFEPLDKASLFYLSVKTVFLVTLPTARRVSEVHALSIDSDHLRFSNLDGSLILRTQVGFLAKNQLPSRAPDSIIIPRLSNYCCKSDNLNRMLCPVRAVKIYLIKTKSLRKHRKRLFIRLEEIRI